MAERLTDRTALTTKPADGDIVYLVDISDTTDNAAGTSKQETVQNLLKGRTFQQILGCMVYKTTASPTTTTIQATDFVIYVTDVRLVIGRAGTGVATIPADLDDPNKFAKFIDNGPAL